MGRVSSREAVPMGFPFYPQFVDHLVFLVEDLIRTRKFYEILLGPPIQSSEDSVMFLAGGTRIFFAPTLHTIPTFDKERIGLNHMAFGVRTLEELRQTAKQLDTAGIWHSGILIDHYGSKEFLWLDDPDQMRLEFYLRAENKD